MVLYSFVVPIYNDGYLAEPFCLEYERVFRAYLGKDDIHHDVELIFVNDGSRNNSFEQLYGLANRFAFVKVINLSRNFGQHIAITCGFNHASGQYVGMIDVDMQDPPNQIPVLLDRMKAEQADAVVAIRPRRKGPWIDRISSKAFHFLLNKLTEANTPKNIGNLRILSRRFVDVYNSLNEHSRFIVGLETWIGFKRIFVPIEHQARQEGQSSYNFFRRLRLGIDAITSFSDVPLQMAMHFGFFLSLCSFLSALMLIIQKLLFVDFLPGYTSIVTLILLALGVQLIAIGLLGLYVGKILREVQNRPLYIVADKINFETPVEESVLS